MSKVWVVRAGTRGSLIDLALRESAVLIGWGELGDLAAIPDPEALRALVNNTCPDDPAASRSKHFWQTRTFRFDIRVSDLVVAPGPPGQALHVGRVTGDCQYCHDLPAEARQIRPVEWLGECQRGDVAQDLQNTLGSLLTVFEIKQSGAEQRLLTVLAGDPDPGPADEPEEPEPSQTPKRQAQLARLRKAMQILANEPTGLHKDEVYRRAVEAVPLVEGEQGSVSGGMPAAQNTLEWMSTTYAYAAWMCKFRGVWSLTRAGKQALLDYADGAAMWTAATQLPDELGLKTPGPWPQPLTWPSGSNLPPTISRCDGRLGRCCSAAWARDGRP